MEQLQEYGLQLMALKPHDLARLPLDGELLRAIEESRRITAHEARRRHAQYVGKLMRDEQSQRVIPALIEMKIRSASAGCWTGRSVWLNCRMPGQRTLWLMKWWRVTPTPTDRHYAICAAMCSPLGSIATQNRRRRKNIAASGKNLRVPERS